MDALDLPQLGDALRHHVIAQRWYRGKARPLERLTIEDRVPLGPEGPVLLVLHLEYARGAPERYALPLVQLQGEAARRCRADHPASLVHRLTDDTQLADGFATGDAVTSLLRHAEHRGLHGTVRVELRSPLSELVATGGGPRLEVSAAEQTNTSVRLGDVALLKLYRALEEGTNVEVEVGEHLTRVTQGRPVAPAVLGSASYHVPGRPACQLALAHQLLPTRGDAWTWFLGELHALLDRSATLPPAPPPPPWPGLCALARTPPPPLVRTQAPASLRQARLLGERVAELHALLATPGPDAAFTPERFTLESLEAMHARLGTDLDATLSLLRARAEALEPAARTLLVDQVLPAEPELRRRAAQVVRFPLGGQRIRTHGDLHLGQVLVTGSDFVIIDFEGEPLRPMAERTWKHSPLRDVMGIWRSFSYAGVAALAPRISGPEERAHLQGWALAWTTWVSAAFLEAYLTRAGTASLLPLRDEERELLLQFHELEKLVYEVAYELNNRPDWVAIPLTGLVRFLERAR